MLLSRKTNPMVILDVELFDIYGVANFVVHKFNFFLPGGEGVGY